MQQSLANLAVQAGNRDLAEDEATVNARRNAAYFKACDENRELLKQICVVVPVRPADGLSVQLAQMLSIWYGEGTGWSMLNDHMGGFIETTRANIAYNFVKARSEKYLLMIDNDMEPPLDLLLTLARHDVPIVGSCAMIYSSTHGPQLCFTVKDEGGAYRFPSLRDAKTIPASGLLEVGHVGTGAMLIRRDVLESFTFGPGDIPFYVPEDVRQKGARTGTLLIGEDIAFCNQARDKGYAIHVDLSAHVGHRKTVALRWPDEGRDATLDPSTWRLPQKGQQIGIR